MTTSVPWVLRQLQRISRPLSLAGALFATAAFAAPAVEDLYRDAREQAAFLSPDGARLAVIVRDGDDSLVDVIDTADGSRQTLYTTSALKADEKVISSVAWTDNDSLLFVVYELVDGVAKLSDTRAVRRVFFRKIGETSSRPRYMQSKGYVLSSLPYEADKILFAVSGSKSYVYRVQPSQLHEWGFRRTKTSRTDNGQITRNNRVAEVEGRAIRWVADATGTVRAVMRINDEGHLELLTRDSNDSEWSSVREWDFKAIEKRMKRAERKGERAAAENDPANRIYFPAAAIDGSDEFVVIAEEEDEPAVFRYNYATGAKAIIYRDEDVDIVDVSLHYDGQTVREVTYFENGSIRFYYPDNQFRDVQAILSERYPDYGVQVASADVAGEYFVANLSSSIQPGRVLVFTRSDGAVVPLYKTRPWLDEAALIASEPGSFKSGEFDVEYYLTLPARETAAPLVVVPHGGPVGIRDLRVYDPFVQHIAAAGFAVLQVNFRGSTGYGAEFEASGRGEFGEGILDDIDLAIDQVVTNPAIDGSRICIAGASYGGYAALMMPLRRPGRFKCSAAHAAPTDLGLLVAAEEEDDRSGLREFLIGEDAGDDAEVYESLKAISPLYRADELVSIPVMLSHGEDDRVVDLEHSLRMKHRLEKIGADVRWLPFSDEGHSFAETEAAVSYSRAVVEFLEEHLGDAQRP